MYKDSSLYYGYVTDFKQIPWAILESGLRYYKQNSNMKSNNLIKSISHWILTGEVIASFVSLFNTSTIQLSVLLIFWNSG